MVNYQEGKIYTLRSHQTDKVYVGSTCTPLPKRLYSHRGEYKRWKDGQNYYCTAWEIVQFEDCYIELHETYLCQSKAELHRREGEIIREIDCVNKRIEGRTDAEYREDNKVHIAEITKKYEQANKEKIAARKKVYDISNKEKIAERKHGYYLKNKEHINARTNAYKQRKKKETQQSLNVVQDGGGSIGERD